MASRKRKHQNASNSNTNPHNNYPLSDQDQPTSLYIQAYEADIIRGPAAKIAAASLEVPLPGSIETGGALIRLGIPTLPAFPQSEDEMSFGVQTKPQSIPDLSVDNRNNIWVDRYDARLLLDTLPIPLSSTPPVENALNSPGGWSDLPSDNEDVFFLDPEEVDDFRRDKKRRHLEELREERLKGRLAEEGEPIDAAEEIWGDNDEEPDDTQRELMHRTANHILSSPNATQLEARILANHGSDPRFSFLRGRWSNAWKIIKGKSRLAKQNEERERRQQSTNILGGLTGYGSGSDGDDDSDRDEDNEERGVQKEIETDNLKVPEPSQPPQMTEEDIKEARRVRAKEWTQKYRLQKNG